VVLNRGELSNVLSDLWVGRFNIGLTQSDDTVMVQAIPLSREGMQVVDQCLIPSQLAEQLNQSAKRFIGEIICRQFKRNATSCAPLRDSQRIIDVQPHYLLNELEGRHRTGNAPRESIFVNRHVCASPGAKRPSGMSVSVLLNKTT
jgi:hypothetical protein